MGKIDCKVEFSIADSHHVEQMHEIEEAVFRIPWSYEGMVEDVCKKKISLYIVGTYGGEVISYAGLWYVKEMAHIINIAVKEDFRRMGVGEQMMHKMFAAAVKLNVKTLTLEVRVSNDAAIGLYEKTGFVKAGLRKRYYPDNYENAVIMNKTL